MSLESSKTPIFYFHGVILYFEAFSPPRWNTCSNYLLFVLYFIYPGYKTAAHLSFLLASMQICLFFTQQVPKYILWNISLSIYKISTYSASQHFFLNKNWVKTLVKARFFLVCHYKKFNFIFVGVPIRLKNQCYQMFNYICDQMGLKSF